LLILALSVFATVCEAKTGYPSVTAWGWDDQNTSTVNPAGAPFLTATPDWLNQALPNSANQENVGWNFNNAAQWTFTFAGNLVSADRLSSFVYTAWVVSNDGYTLPNGNPAQTRDVTGDVGGANYTLDYVPRAWDPGGGGDKGALANVHFLQIVQATSNYGDDATGQVTSTITRYFLDGANANSPWYDATGTFGYANNSTEKWMDDTPYRTEDLGGYGDGQSDATPDLLSINWEANTFIAVDTGANGTTQNNVLLYGGRDWGFIYSDTDVPEPSTFAMVAVGALMIAGRSWFRRKASPE
jgi:hypothetical protein